MVGLHLVTVVASEAGTTAVTTVEQLAILIAESAIVEARKHC